MGIKKLVSSRRREHEEEEPTPNHDAGEEQSESETDSGSESGEEVAVPLVPPKKPKSFITPQNPVENGGSACSSPSASAFIIVPSKKPSGDTDTDTNIRKASASKVFSDEDVIALLKGLSVFWTNGKNNKWAEFHIFIKDNLQKQFTKSQVSEKIRALKKKFFTNSERAWDNGGSLELSDPHEWTVFELSKDLWGDETCVAPEQGHLAENKDVEEEADEIVRETQMAEYMDGEEADEIVRETQMAEDMDEDEIVRETENEEGSKSTKKQKQLGEHGEVNKKTRKREHVDELDGKKELLKEGMRVDEHDEATEIPSQKKLFDECGSKGKRKMKKRKQVDERDEANKTAEVEEHDGHKVEEDLATQEKQVDEHHEGDNIPVDQKQEMKISYDIFQSSYPLLCESFDIFRFPMVAKLNCHLIGRENAQELEEMWKEYSAEVHRLELKKLDLMKRDSQGRR